MKVKELVERYEKNNRIDIAKAIEARQYVSIELKRQMAELVMDNCTTVVDGQVRINSIERYILFTISVIGMHTNLEFYYEDDDEYSAIGDYDMLCESGLLGKVIDTFKDDYASCQEILNMVTSDRLQDNMTFERKLGNFLDEIQNFLSDTVDNLVGKLDIDKITKDLPVDQGKLLDLFNVMK